MDRRTGLIHKLEPGETVDDVQRRLNAKQGDLVLLGKPPDGKCSRCGGTGRRRAGLFSRRFKPCRCTEAREEAGER